MGKSDSQQCHCIKVTHCSMSSGCIFLPENKLFHGTSILTGTGGSLGPIATVTHESVTGPGQSCSHAPEKDWSMSTILCGVYTHRHISASSWIAECIKF